MKKFTFYKLLSLVLVLIISVSTIKSLASNNKIKIDAFPINTSNNLDTKLTNGVKFKPMVLKSIDANKIISNEKILINTVYSNNVKNEKLLEDISSNEDESIEEETIEESTEKEIEDKSSIIEKEPITEQDQDNQVVKEQTKESTPQVIGTYSDWEIYEWAKIVYCEAGGESQLCKEYIAQVILNRVNSSSFPNTIHGVIFDGIQFSPTFDGSWERKEPNQACYDAVYTVINSSEPITNALFFEACRGDSWHSRNLTEVAAIDNTRFYIK